MDIRPPWRFRPTEIASIVVATIACVGAIISAFYSYANRNRELDVKLIELGIGILRADPKDSGLTAARAWAVQVMENYSQIKFSDRDRAELLQRPLLFEDVKETIRQLNRTQQDLSLEIERQNEEAKRAINELKKGSQPGKSEPRK